MWCVGTVAGAAAAQEKAVAVTKGFVGELGGCGRPGAPSLVSEMCMHMVRVKLRCVFRCVRENDML